MKPIEDLLREHRASRFPPACRDQGMTGVNLVAVEERVAGCAQWALEEKKPSHLQVSLLRRCRTDLDLALGKLQGEEKAYVARLDSLAATVLAEASPSSLLSRWIPSWLRRR
jgi:hypothetical protein